MNYLGCASAPSNIIALAKHILMTALKLIRGSIIMGVETKESIMYKSVSLSPAWNSWKPPRKLPHERFPDSSEWRLSRAIVWGLPSILASKFKKPNLKMIGLLWFMGILRNMKNVICVCINLGPPGLDLVFLLGRKVRWPIASHQEIPTQPTI